jgi:hypothetical protein
MQRDGEFDDSQVGPQVTTGARDGVHQEFTDLVGQLGQLGLVESRQVSRAVDALDHTHLRSLIPERAAGT